MKTIIAIALALVLFGCLGGSGGGVKSGANNSAEVHEPDEGAQAQPSASDDSAPGTVGEGTQGGASDTGGTGPDDSVSGNDGGDSSDVSDSSDSPDSKGKTEVLMLGRSVAYGWSEYMGLEWQEDESYYGTYEGKKIRYLHMDYPPDIDDSAIRAIRTYDPDIVFFKLCFVDFSTEYGDMLAEDKEYVENVYREAVMNRHKRLIVGNALPQVSRDTTSGLKQNHQEYDRWLDEFASTHANVSVLDLHGMLSDGSGALRSDYASSYEDSHPNRAGYARITPAFMGQVEQVQGG